MIQNALFDAVLSTDIPTLNPMELLTEQKGDVYDITIMTTETLEALLNLLKLPKCSSHLLDGPYVTKNKRYAPATAEH